MTSQAKSGGVAYIVALHLWRAAAGVVTVLLVVSVFSADLQGIYYTFIGMIALQGLFELGFNVAVLNIAAREWAGIEFSVNAGSEPLDRSADSLVALGRRASAWYLAAAALFAVLVGTAGFVLFDRPQIAQVAWRLPWTALVLSTSVQLATMPVATMLEACGRFSKVARVRLWTTVAGSLTSFVVLAGGGGLWALVASSLFQGAVFAILLASLHRQFLKMFLRRPAVEHRGWSRRLWPMQWRIGLQNLAAYAVTNFLTVVLFQFEGAVAAGRFGMSWQVTSMLNQVAMAPVQAQAPFLAVHAARRDFVRLDRTWRNSASQTITAVLVLSLAALAVLLILGRAAPGVAMRMLPITEFAALLTGVTMIVVLQCEALYLRAFGREPFLAVGVVSGTTGGALAWVLASQHMGVTFAYLTSAAIAFVWGTLVYARLRIAWRGAAS